MVAIVSKHSVIHTPADLKQHGKREQFHSVLCMFETSQSLELSYHPQKQCKERHVLRLSYHKETNQTVCCS